MKIVHLSDLHIGKKLNGYSMIDLQIDIINKILHRIEDEKPDCVLLAGDIYDKALPSAQAVTVFDDFLYALSALPLHTMVISGNHDSPERLSFGGRIMEEQRIHIAPVFNGQIKKVTLTDAYGPVHFYLLPFIRPAAVRLFYPEEVIADYNDALRTVLAHSEIDYSQRNVMVSHQFVSGGQEGGSEERIIGGLENVSAELYEQFDYTALGHLHTPQSVQNNPYIRYCGTPLPYAFSECGTEKSLSVLTLGEKGERSLRTIPLEACLSMREIRDRFDQILRTQPYTEELIQVTLTDENEVPNALGRLRELMPNLLELRYENRRTAAYFNTASVTADPALSPKELVARFFAQQNNQSLSEQQEKYIEALIEEVWRAEA